MKVKLYRPKLRSKNTSCESLRPRNRGLGVFPVRSIVRLGSQTLTEKVFPNFYGKTPIVEINTVDSIQNSRSKLLMKACFANADVKQANWWDSDKALANDEKSIQFPILAKRVFGFKGHGMVKLDNKEQLEEWLSKNSTSGYYFEEFKNYAREYRLHVTKDGCFMAWRKLRKSDSEERWFFNSSNCNWVGENHELFDKPTNWNVIEQHCVNALNAVGLDIGSCDLRIQSAKKENPDFIVVEINSAPSLGENGVKIYGDVIKSLINDKINNLC